MGWLLRGAGRRARRGRGGRACPSARTARGWAREPRRGFLGPRSGAPCARPRDPPASCWGQRRRGWTPCLCPLRLLTIARVRLAPGGAPEQSFLGVVALLASRGGSGELGGSRGSPRRIPRARTPDRSGLRREGAAARLGRACARARCHPWGLVSAPGLAPSPFGGPAAPSAQAAAGRGSASGPRCVPPRPLPKAPGPERDGLLERAKTPSAAARSRRAPLLDTSGCGGCGEATSLPTSFASSDGG